MPPHGRRASVANFCQLTATQMISIDAIALTGWLMGLFRRYRREVILIRI